MIIKEPIFWICEVAFMLAAVVYACTLEKRENFGKRAVTSLIGFVIITTVINMLPIGALRNILVLVRGIAFLMIVIFLWWCWNISWSVAIYTSVWAFMSWQLLYEIWIGIMEAIGSSGERNQTVMIAICIAVFMIGYLLVGFTIARWMPMGAPKNIGPRQLVSSLLILIAFEMIALSPGNAEITPNNWRTLYLSQLLLAMILYLQSELFKKSAMRQELAVMNLLWKKEQEQYQLSKENIALINQKCHDLKHQIRAIRNASKEEIDKYLEEMEDTIRIYESIVKTGNDVLDTILTEKSLYCKDRGITVSCVADGSQMDFINTVDLYAILGNALDNAIEAVEKFKHKEKRQIDVMIYRQQSFLVMNIVNPMKEELIFEEELPVSTKGDNRYHGFGLRSMKYLVKKYDGYLTVSKEDGCFSLKILIPIPSA